MIFVRFKSKRSAVAAIEKYSRKLRLKVAELGSLNKYSRKYIPSTDSWETYSNKEQSFDSESYSSQQTEQTSPESYGYCTEQTSPESYQGYCTDTSLEQDVLQDKSDGPLDRLKNEKYYCKLITVLPRFIANLAHRQNSRLSRFPPIKNTPLYCQTQLPPSATGFQIQKS